MRTETKKSTKTWSILGKIQTAVGMIDIFLKWVVQDTERLGYYFFNSPFLWAALISFIVVIGMRVYRYFQDRDTENKDRDIENKLIQKFQRLTANTDNIYNSYAGRPLKEVVVENNFNLQEKRRLEDMGYIKTKIIV